MTFKISVDDFFHWEYKNWYAVSNSYGGSRNRDNFDNRYGQKFINDHRDKGFIHTDPEVFYEEDFLKAREAIFRKYVVPT